MDGSISHRFRFIDGESFLTCPGPDVIDAKRSPAVYVFLVTLCFGYLSKFGGTCWVCVDCLSIGFLLKMLVLPTCELFVGGVGSRAVNTARLNIYVAPFLTARACFGESSSGISAITSLGLNAFTCSELTSY